MNFARLPEKFYLQFIANYAMLANMQNNGITPMGAPEACDLLDVSRDTLIRMIASGKIRKATKLPGQNGSWVLDRAEIEGMATAKADVTA